MEITPAIDRHGGGHTIDDTQNFLTNTSWLLLLRWVAVIGQMLTIAIAHYVIGVDLPMVALMTVIGITAISNVLFAIWVHRMRGGDTSQPTDVDHPFVLAAVMALDLILLTALLFFAGGPSNPFSIFYLVNLALCAIVLSERWGWLLTAVALLGMLFVVVVHVDIPGLFVPVDVGILTSPTTLEELGRVVATAACGLVIIHFVSRVTRQLEVTAAELRRVERERSRSERLESLGTLAGGAAHELATPLSTIAVVAKEMIRHLQAVEVPDSVREDAALIRSQVDQCQKILQRMTGGAGQWMAEEHKVICLQEFVGMTLNELAQRDRIRVRLADDADQVMVAVPLESTGQALRGLLQNALDATTNDAMVDLVADWSDERIQIRVKDQGPGMSEDVLQRAGEPFFTTKEPGRGMGLGLFLTRSVIERLGGTLELHSEAGHGVVATVEIPRQVAAP